jgi:hypothetical protein
MRIVSFTVVFLLSAGAVQAAETCKAQADDKKLAGAARTSFTTKCEKDSMAACEATAMERKLAGAARTSFVTKCAMDAAGT